MPLLPCPQSCALNNARRILHCQGVAGFGRKSFVFERFKEDVAAIAGGCCSDVRRRVAPFQVDVVAISEGCYSDLKRMFQEEITENCFPSFFPCSLNVTYSYSLCLPTHGHLRPYWPAFGRGQDREVGTTYSQAMSLAWGPQYTHHTL